MLKRSPSPFSSVRLGLLDDDDFHASVLRTAASLCDIRSLTVFADPADALGALRRPEKPTIMLIHDKPPERLGAAFCRAVRDRKSSPCPFLPIIMICAGATRADVVRARDAGVDEFLVSPYSPKAFAGRISSILFSRRGFIEVDGFFGPDRRRGAMAEMLGECRRSAPVELIDPETGETYMG